jgi:hypothetical protein
MLCGVKSSIAVTQCASRSGAEAEIKIVLYGSTSRLCHAAAVTNKTPQQPTEIPTSPSSTARNMTLVPAVERWRYKNFEHLLLICTAAINKRLSIFRLFVFNLKLLQFSLFRLAPKHRLRLLPLGTVITGTFNSQKDSSVIRSKTLL